MFTLGIEVRELVDKIVSDDIYKENLGGILINNGFAVATDTRILLQVPLIEVREDDVPMNILEGNEIKEATWISKKGIQKAFKNLPDKSILPILNNIFIRKTEKEIQMTTTDLEHTVSVKESLENDNEKLAQFPDTNGLNGTPKPVYSVTIGANYLKTLADIAIKLKQNSLNFIFEECEQGEDKGIKFYFKTDNGMCKGILMPMRKEDTLEAMVATFESQPIIDKKTKEESVKPVGDIQIGEEVK